MPTFPKELLDEIRSKNDIVETIQAYVPLKRNYPPTFIGPCPFHPDTGMHFTVHKERQIYHCFECHQGGDIFRFIQEREGVNFEKAVELLRDGGWPIKHREVECTCHMPPEWAKP